MLGLFGDGLHIRIIRLQNAPICLLAFIGRAPIGKVWVLPHGAVGKGDLLIKCPALYRSVALYRPVELVDDAAGIGEGLRVQRVEVQLLTDMRLGQLQGF